MRLSTAAAFGTGAFLAAGLVGLACGNNNGPITAPPVSGSSTSSSSSGATNGSSSSSGSSNSAAAGSSSGSVSSSGSGSSSGAGSGGGSGSSGVVDAGSSDAAICPSTLKDKMTTCTGTEPTCYKGCGPEMAGGIGNNLGSKGCSCNAGTLVYSCQSCVYPQPLPSCYAPSSTTPPACTADVVDKMPCTTPCSGVCTQMTDAGKLAGCVCQTSASGTSTWTCATQWW